jgi:hypothetical protein
MSLASINSSKMNFLQACVMLTRGQWNPNITKSFCCCIDQVPAQM